MARILVVDDEEAIRTALQRILERQAHETVSTGSLKEAREVLGREDLFDVALVDLRLPDGEGTELLADIHRSGGHASAVMISGHGTISAAVEAVKQGAFDFLEKPLDRERLLITVRNAAAQARLRRDASEPENGVTLITESPAMRPLLEEAAKLAPADVPLFISGETGVGKEVLARWIHERSSRRNGPFVALNCAALPESLAESELFGHAKGAFTGASSHRKGKFMAAAGGTLFLDEIGDLSPAVQAKLLRVLEESAVEPVGSDRLRPVDVRVIAASHRDLKDRVARGRFREDLLFRVAGFPLHIPALRERPEDILVLAQYFMDGARKRQGWPPASLPAESADLLARHLWPGNVRELRWALERATLLAGPGLPAPSHLPSELASLPLGAPDGRIRKRALQEAEARAIQEALAAASGRVTEAAKKLGMSRSRLYERLKDLEISPSAFR